MCIWPISSSNKNVFTMRNFWNVLLRKKFCQNTVCFGKYSWELTIQRQLFVKNAAIISLRGISVYSSSSFLKSTQASLLVNQFYLLESIPVFRSGWYSEEQKKVQLNNNTQINKVKKPSVSWPTSKKSTSGDKHRN